MKVFGYAKNNEELMDLREASLLVNMNELDKLIEFLQMAKEKHGHVKNSGDFSYSHFRDWDRDWQVGDGDLIIAMMKE